MDCNKCSDQNSGTTACLEVTLFNCEYEANCCVEANSWHNECEWLGSAQPKACPQPPLKLILPNYTYERQGHPEFSKNNKRLKTPSSTCPCTKPDSVASSYLANCRILKTNNVQKKNKKGKRCPLRVAELAVPTKRQLIETWRNKSRVLPGYMVERLKLHVMDQIPIAKIPDAIYCFQTERRATSKKSSFSWGSKKQQVCGTLKPSCKMNTKMLCILFAHRVAKELSSRRLKLTLNADLARLSKIVSSDIAKMMPKYRDTCQDRQYKAFLIDVTNKITFWITGILEDSAFKLLEEDLRVKMATEAQTETMVEFSKPFFMIAKAIIEQENPMQSKDLEEEEGAVLDFIDDVVDNVMDVCDPPQLHIDSYSDSSESTKSITLGKESEESPESDVEKQKKADDALIDSYKDLSDSEHFRNEISHIIDNITKEFGVDISNGLGKDIQNGSRDNTENNKISKSETKQDINGENNTGVKMEAGIEHDINDEKNTEITVDVGIEHDINDKKNAGIIVEAGIEHDINENKDDILPEEGKRHVTNDENFDQIDESSLKVEKTNGANNNADETQSNVSERLEKFNDTTVKDSNVSEHFEIITDDSDDNKNSKKHTKTNLVNADKAAEETKTSTTEDPEPNKHKQTQMNFQNNKSSIVFAEPNQNLLSDADESWPADLGDTPMLKVSDSASKSVLSLGRITENDENIMLSPEEDGKSMADKDDTILKLSVILDKLDSLLPNEKHDTASQSCEPQIKEFIETSGTETGVKQVKKKNLDEKDNSKTITWPEICDDKPVDKSFKQEGSTGHQTDSGESEPIRRGSTADRSEDNKICGVRRQAALGWKVCPKTAPPWVYAWDQGRGEPSEDSMPIQKRPAKVTESELRTWCKDLETAFTNLDIWNNWISTTCKETLCILKQKRLACPGLARKCAINWCRLQRNVYKDALLWTKLYKRTANNFKCLKNKYNNIEIVTAEYCAMCACVKNKTRYNLNKECRGYSTHRKHNNTPCLKNNRN